MDEVLKVLLPSISTGVLILLFLLFIPEKIETWSALLWKWLSHFGGLFKHAHKRYVKHDLQGRVNAFVKKLRVQVPGVAEAKMRIDWVGAEIERKAFLDRYQVSHSMHCRHATGHLCWRNSGRTRTLRHHPFG